MADMCGFLYTLHTRQGLMADEAKRRQVALNPAELKEAERSPLGAEVLFWVMEVYDEGDNPRDPTRISMAEAVFKKVAEDRPARHGAVVPGCCHTCGGHIRSNHRGHDDAKGSQYEGRTREACYELEVIKAAGPCSLCTDLEEYLRGEHEGNTDMLTRLAKGVPKAHLDKNCPLQGFACQHAYWTLRKFIKGVAGRLEVKMASIVQESRLQGQAALRR